MRRIIIAFFTFSIITFLIISPVQAGTRTPTPTPDPAIRFGQTWITYELPDFYTFHIKVESPDYTPVKGNIRLYLYEGEVVEATLKIDPVHPRELNYSISPLSFILYPNVPVHVRWDVSDVSGRAASSDYQEVVGQDARYQWQTLKSDKRDLTVLYHDRSPSFGETIFDTAEKSAEFMEENFDAHLTKPIMVVIYNSHDEVRNYYTDFGDSIGGQAFSDLGLTMQIIQDDKWMEDWINDVIPHEISHLYFYQATGGDKLSWMLYPPTWLNEGIAQINATGNDSQQLEDINWQLSHSAFLPNLRYLDAHFGENEDVLTIEYQMAYSVTSYILNTYGEESVADLLAAYADNASCENAFIGVLGVNFLTLEKEWRKASGLPSEEKYYSGPKDTPTPTRGPSPTPTATPTPKDNSKIVTGGFLGLAALCLCCFILVLFIFVLLLVINQQKKKKESDRTSQPFS